MNVLITGAGGFIGSHLVDSQLAKGNKVSAFDLHAERLEHARTNPQLTVIEADITDPAVIANVVKGIDIVYHLASAHLDVTLPDKYYEKVNIEAARNLVEISHLNGVKKFVHCSSVGVIGDVEIPPADENTSCNPTNIYEKTKLAGETSVLQYARQSSYDVVVARPAWVYGPRCPRTSKLFKSIKKGRFLLFGSCRNLRHPIFITDAIKGLELCAETKDIDGQIFILAGDKPFMTRELVNEIATVTGAKASFLKLPLFTGIIAGSLIEKLFIALHKDPPLSRRSLDFFTKNNAYDISKARKFLGFNPQIVLRPGLQQTYKLINHPGSIY